MESEEVSSILHEAAEKQAALLAEQMEAKGGILGPKEAFLRQKTEAIEVDFQEKDKELESIFHKGCDLIYEAMLSMPEEERDRFFVQAEQIVKTLETLDSNSREEDLGNIVRPDPFFSEIVYAIGLKNYEAGKFEEALCLWILLSLLLPSSATVRSGIGFVQEKLGKDQEAYEAFSEAAELDPENFLPHYHMGNIRYQKQEFPEAVAHWEQALALVEKQNKPEEKEELMQLLAKANRSM